MNRRLYEVVVLRDDRNIEEISTHLDLESEKDLKDLVLGAIKRQKDHPIKDLPRYALAVHLPGERTPKMTWVAVDDK